LKKYFINSIEIITRGSLLKYLFPKRKILLCCLGLTYTADKLWKCYGDNEVTQLLINWE